MDSIVRTVVVTMVMSFPMWGPLLWWAFREGMLTDGVREMRFRRTFGVEPPYAPTLELPRPINWASEAKGVNRRLEKARPAVETRLMALQERGNKRELQRARRLAAACGIPEY